MLLSGRRRTTVPASISLLFLGLSLTAASAAVAQDEREPGLYDEAELSLVVTAGNSESNAFGLKNRLERLWPSSRLTFDLGGIRIESGRVTRQAVGTGPNDFEVQEETIRETTAENYFATVRFDRDLSERTFAYASGGWVRNRPAGVDNRFTGAVGLGRKLIDTERTHFQADVGATITSAERLVGGTDSFAGARFSWDFGHQLTESTKFASLLIVDENLADTDDLRGEFDNSIAVNMSETLALKTALKLLFDNQPAFEQVDLFATPGGPSIGSVPVELDGLDTQLTVALVITI
jgi:putative salt-induced outer membrane protein